MVKREFLVQRANTLAGAGAAPGRPAGGPAPSRRRVERRGRQRVEQRRRRRRLGQRRRAHAEPRHVRRADAVGERLWRRAHPDARLDGVPTDADAQRRLADADARSRACGTRRRRRCTSPRRAAASRWTTSTAGRRLRPVRRDAGINQYGGGGFGGGFNSMSASGSQQGLGSAFGESPFGVDMNAGPPGYQELVGVAIAHRRRHAEFTDGRHVGRRRRRLHAAGRRAAGSRRRGRRAG